MARNESLERGLLLLNEYPSLKASATLEAGKSVGATDVHVNVEDKRPLHFMLDVNNYGFNTISRYRFGAGVEVGNVLMDGGTLTLNAIWGNHPDQLLFGMGNYRLSDRRTKAPSSCSEALTESSTSAVNCPLCKSAA